MRYLVMCLALMTVVFFASAAEYIQSVKTWKCPMAECKVTGQPKAGKCTVCGMNLVHETVGKPIPAQ